MILEDNKIIELFFQRKNRAITAISEKYGGVFTIERRESSCEATLIFPI